jgi:hypothetical protein
MRIIPGSLPKESGVIGGGGMHGSGRTATEVLDGLDYGVHHRSPEEERYQGEGDYEEDGVGVRHAFLKLA